MRYCVQAGKDNITMKQRFIEIILQTIQIAQKLMGLLTQKQKQEMRDLITRIAIEERVDATLACKVAEAESGLNPRAILRNKDLHKSTDRGLFQFNSKWYAHITDECAFNPECAARAFCKAVKNGRLKDWRYSAKYWNKDNKYNHLLFL